MSVGLTRLQVTDTGWQRVEGTWLRWNLLSLGIQESFDISGWGSLKKHVGLRNNWKQDLKCLCFPVSTQFSCRLAFFAHHNVAAGSSQFYILELQYIKLYIQSLEKSELTLLVLSQKQWGGAHWLSLNQMLWVRQLGAVRTSHSHKDHPPGLGGIVQSMAWCWAGKNNEQEKEK